MQIALLFVAAFLVGSIPFGLIIGRLKGIDIRKHGSGNIGSTNVGRVLGRKFGLVCFAFDLLKGLVPTLIAGIIMDTAGRLAIEPVEAWKWMIVMVAPPLGHIFCPWIGFKGGKGVATGFGTLLGLFPVLTIPAAGLLAVWLISLWFKRYVGLSSALAAGSLPLWVAAEFVIAYFAGVFHEASVRGTSPLAMAVPFMILTTLLAALVVVKHRENLRRVMAGTEPRVTWFGRA